MLLCRSSDTSVRGQVGEKGFYLRCGHILGVTDGALLCSVKEDKALDPIHVGMFGVNGIVFFAQDGADTSTKLSAGLVEQFLLGAFRLCSHVFALRA